MYKPKIILITGGCGYLGSQLIRDLPKKVEGYVIRILDNFNDGKRMALHELPDNGHYQFIEGDILNPEILDIALTDVDTVIHLAAIVKTPLSFENPNWVEQINHWGTSHLFKACISHKIRRFIFASSTAVYGPNENINEESFCSPIGAYANSKYRAEKCIKKLKNKSPKITILRFGSIYGDAQVMRYDSVVNRFAYLAGTRKSIPIYGSGEQLRPFIHVKDSSNALCYCINDSQTEDEILNIVEGNYSIKQIADYIKEKQPYTNIRYTEQDIRTHYSFEVSNKKVLSKGWIPKITMRDGVFQLLKKYNGFERVRGIGALN